MNPLSTSSKKGAKIPISIELWKELSNHASEMSARLGRKISVDEFASYALEFGLNDEAILKKAIKEAKERQQKKCSK